MQLSSFCCTYVCMNAIFGFCRSIRLRFVCARIGDYQPIFAHSSSTTQRIRQHTQYALLAATRSGGSLCVRSCVCLHAILTISSAMGIGRLCDLVCWSLSFILFCIVVGSERGHEHDFCEYWPRISPARSNVARISFSPFRAIKEATRESTENKSINQNESLEIES